MSFIWRSGVIYTTPSDISDTGLLAIRIVLTVVLGIGLLYGFLILRTFRRYGEVMDKAWQKRIGEWVQGKETLESSFIQPLAAVDNRRQSHQHPSKHYASGHPPVPTYSWDTYSPPSDAAATYDSDPTYVIQTQTGNSQSSKLQCDDRITSDQDEYFPSPETTLEDSYYIPLLNPPPPSPPPPPNRLIYTAEDSEISPRLIIQKIPPCRPLPPTPKTPITSSTDQSSPTLSLAPRPLPPIPPATPFIDQSNEDKDNALGFSIGTTERETDNISIDLANSDFWSL